VIFFELTVEDGAPPSGSFRYKKQAVTKLGLLAGSFENNILIE